MSSDYVKRYAPDVVKDNSTMDNLYTIQADEINALNTSISNVINNNFISTSNLEGIKQWESLLDVQSNSDYTLEERRSILLNKMLYRPPFTRQRLNEILNNIWGDGNYMFELYPDKYEVVIDINTTDPIIYLHFNKDVRAVIPANMYLIFSIQYTYLYLRRNYTYSKLENDGLTYEELSKYAGVET